MTTNTNAALREKLIDMIAEHLSGTYRCLRVWEAWNFGTMSQDDFDDVGEYANSWLQAYIQRKAESPTQPAAPASQDAEDAARYRYLKKYKTWDSTDVFYWLRCAPADEVDSIIDAARSAQGESNDRLPPLPPAQGQAPAVAAGG